MVNISKANAKESKDEIESKSEEEQAPFLQEDSNEVVENNQKKSPSLSLKGNKLKKVFQKMALEI